MGRGTITLLDVAVIGLVAAVCGTLAAVGGQAIRDDARTVRCLAQQGQIGAGNAQFALANQDVMVGLTWQKGGANSRYPDLNAQQASSILGAHASQVVDILRRRGRRDIPLITNWVPDIMFWSLPLVDFEDRGLSDPFNICPADMRLAQWRRDPTGFDMGVFLPYQPTPSGSNTRWPYRSTYMTTAGAFDVHQSQPSSPMVTNARLYQAGTHNTYAIPSSIGLGPSMMSLVAFPSRKAHAFDEHQRHRPGSDLYFMYDGATLPVLMFDGSIGVRLVGHANLSWVPNAPTSPFPTMAHYMPPAWQPPAANGQPSESVTDRLRWTRDGLLGWDFAN